MIFSDLFKDIADGAVWVDGALLKRLAKALDADRARLVQNAGNEMPTEDGRWFDISTSGNAGAKGPWSIVAGSDADKVKIKNATLLNSASLTDTLAITGIDDDQTLTSGQFLYLQLTYTGGLLDSASLVADDRWTEYPIPYTVTGSGTFGDPYILTKAYFLVGYAAAVADADGLDGVVITLLDDTKLKIVRCCFTPLEIMFKNLGGGFIVPFPEASTRNGPT